MDLRRAVLSLQDVSNGNDVIGVGADDNGIYRGALRRHLSSAARSDNVDTPPSAQGRYRCHPSSYSLSRASVGRLNLIASQDIIGGSFVALR